METEMERVPILVREGSDEGDGKHAPAPPLPPVQQQVGIQLGVPAPLVRPAVDYYLKHRLRVTSPTCAMPCAVTGAFVLATLAVISGWVMYSRLYDARGVELSSDAYTACIKLDCLSDKSSCSTVRDHHAHPCSADWDVPDAARQNCTIDAPGMRACMGAYGEFKTKLDADHGLYAVLVSFATVGAFFGCMLVVAVWISATGPAPRDPALDMRYYERAIDAIKELRTLLATGQVGNRDVTRKAVNTILFNLVNVECASKARLATTAVRLDAVLSWAVPDKLGHADPDMHEAVRAILYEFECMADGTDLPPQGRAEIALCKRLN